MRIFIENCVLLTDWAKAAVPSVGDVMEMRMSRNAIQMRRVTHPQHKKSKHEEKDFVACIPLAYQCLGL